MDKVLCRWIILLNWKNWSQKTTHVIWRLRQYTSFAWQGRGLRSVHVLTTRNKKLANICWRRTSLLFHNILLEKYWTSRPSTPFPLLPLLGIQLQHNFQFFNSAVYSTVENSKDKRLALNRRDGNAVSGFSRSLKICKTKNRGSRTE